MANARSSDEGLTPRGARTKAALIDAAWDIFERDGFLHARITDIADAAGVAHGTFYTYFPDKESIFRAVVDRLTVAFQGENVGSTDPDASPYERILEANRRYYDVYARTGKMMGILEQVATFSDEFREMRRAVRHAWVDRAERSIRRWQQEGLADTRLDPRYAASSLGSMVDRSVYVWLVLEEPHDRDVAVEMLSRLWANAIGLPTPPAASGRRARRSSTRRAPTQTSKKG